jgi:hypothetical protein
MVVPPNHPFIDGFSVINQPFGVPHKFRENDEIGTPFCHVCGHTVLLEHQILSYIIIYYMFIIFINMLVKSLHHVLSYH